MIKKKHIFKILTFCAFTALISIGSKYVFARTVAGFDCIVPKMAPWVSSSLEKQNIGTQGVTYCSSIGGGYSLKTALTNNSAHKETDEYSISSKGTVIYDYYNGGEIEPIRLAFNSPWNVWVQVEAKGSWSPDR